MLILRWARYGIPLTTQDLPTQESGSTMATSALVGSGGSAIQRISDTAAMASIPQRTMADGWFGWIGLCMLSV